MEWQPIETAPKDGTEIDLWFPDASCGYRIPDARWDICRSGSTKGGYAWHDWSHRFGWQPISGQISDATHWMLPEPPVIQNPAGLSNQSGEYSRGWADGEREGRLAQLRIQDGIRLERDRYREALTEANEETKLYPGHEGRWGKLLNNA